ncbi:MAG: D-alanine--poly(phosphoribitol) ligase [Anaerolineaceae bacterium]|nr:D-alanine--poly(phosphoribitol) ligase [Anaerolineaceae bacterium]
MKNIYMLHQSVELFAETTPDKEAVRFNKESLSYAELFEKSQQLAFVLQTHGVKRGDRVGIFMYKNIYSAVALYGIMAAGAAYVPLDPYAPPNRIEYIIKNCEINIVVCHDRKKAVLEEIEPNLSLSAVIGIDSIESNKTPVISWDTVFNSPSELANPFHGTEQDIAYILYTSGSTGVPKGIVHTHRSGLSFAKWAAETYQLTPNDVLSSHAPLHFDLSTFDFYAGSLVGATTVLIPEALTKFPANLSKWIQDEKITVWYSVPFALIQLMQRGKLSEKNLSSLRWVLFAGEPFPTKHLRELMKIISHASFSNLYGPTETNVCTFYNVEPIPEDQNDLIPIGKACHNIEALVVDEEGQVVADGEVGELYIRGGVVMLGYWGRPDLTEKGFYKRNSFDQFLDIFYRTGDLVQLRPDGNFRFLGRKDRQIKTRGYRVELDEIETTILSHADIQEAAVFPVSDGDGSHLIEAAVIPRADSGLTTDHLYSLLNENLPNYAIPSKIYLLDDFPRTSTGKIDRRALQDLTKNLI